MAPTTPKTPKKVTPAKRVTTLSSPASPIARVRKSQRDAPDLDSEMVFVLLGDGPKELRQTKVFHRNLLMSISGFFARGLTPGFREAEAKLFELEEEDSATFSVFEQWVYKDRLFIKRPTSIESASASDTDDDDHQEWECLPRLYTLGERLDAPNFKDAVISAIIEKVAETKVMPDTWASYVYQNTVSGNALRRLIVDFHVFAHQGRLLKKGACPDAVEPGYEFLQDVVQRMADVGQEVFTAGGEMPWVDACVYHEHGQGACHLAAEEDVMHTVHSLYGTPETPLRRSALAQFEAFKVNEPRPLGIALPLDSAQTVYFWQPYVSLSIDWGSIRQINDLNRWKLRVIRETKDRLGIRLSYN
ncbi:unnamed protein product [Aureobasidium vineae]|uniref:BTB domain-containing protein n=1 Tax=Aureobasidium vineae TaxID=2773715 RepID=A0A9N8P5Q7_9PEZI|nr:unnamed protein product [Aureobasidium vineae]